ncbi:outer membrane protein transport protein [Vibrio viridaestus]|uniref:Aromatic hydrocarbon degradation protein n=1 Tax=Vibrio viridaestus TaxID=2487322 RepID=A0A3N9TI01_9VIBR|nr:outer membrane protein transport protein [Vibrio viridaestus]RQW63155.1 aromatic hydrocarbon degradation protein [Vibrio viridaestus]
MNSSPLFRRSLLAVALSITAQNALAAGFQVNAQSATGLGRAFAGDGVIADNASVIARNAAAMALFDDVSMSLGFETITTLIDVKNATYQNVAGVSTDASYDDAGDTSIVPNFYLVVPVNEQFAWGVSAYSNFGTKTSFADDYKGYEYGGNTDVASMNFGLTGSYRIDEQWSIGAGIDFIYGKGKLSRNAQSTLAAAAFSGQDEALNADADGWALGYNLGAVYELDENNRFGLDYHYSPDLKADGDISYIGYTGANGAISDTLVMPLPDIAEFSGYHRLNQSFAVHYSIQWINWSEFDVLNADTSGTLKTYQWQDGWHYSVGGTYYLNNKWTLRAGYMYDTSAQDSITSISVPDSDRQWFSTGFTYQLTEKSTVDFGFTYLVGKDVHVSETSTLSSLTATTHADAVLMGLQYSRSF